MADPQKKRLLRRSGTSPQAKKSVTPPVSKARTAAAAVSILLVALLVVIAFVKYTGKSRTTDTAPGPVAAESGQTGSTAEGPRDSNVAAITKAVIVPSNPSSRTPLSIVYETSNPGGVPLTPTFRWYVDNARVQEGPSNALQPGPYRKGASVYAEVALSDQTAGSNALMTPAVVIANGPPEVTMVTLEPENAVAGTMLSATPLGSDPDGDSISCTYQWQVNGNPVGAPVDERTFSTAGLHKKDIVSVMVNYTDGTTKGTPVSSNSIRLQNMSPKITSAPPLGLTSGLYVYQVVAKDPDGDPLTFRLDRFPAGMVIDASSGLIRWELPKGTIFTGRNEIGVAVTANDGDGGTDSQEFTIVITDFFAN
jgi:hypothetical protein